MKNTSAIGVTLEFNLPKDLEAFSDAVNGRRWRQLFHHVLKHVLVFRDIIPDAGHKRALTKLVELMRSEMGYAGLTVVSDALFQAEWKSHAKFCKDQYEKYLKESGMTESMEELSQEATTAKSHKKSKANSKLKKTPATKTHDEADIPGNPSS